MAELDKAPTGIAGLDAALEGGVARGRATLLSGGPGSGKTLLALSSATNTAAITGQPALFVAFEEPRAELIQSARSIGLPIDEALDSGRLTIDGGACALPPDAEIGDYDLSGLTIRLQHQVESTGAVLVALDTLEALFGSFGNELAVRRSLGQLLAELKALDVAVVVTAENDGALLRAEGLEAYLADCVILVRQEIASSVTTRRLRIAKYRGSAHAGTELPFLIDHDGVHVMPVESAMLDHQPLAALQKTGDALLDEALGGGVRKGSTTLISGATGVGKTQLAAMLAAENCRDGKRSLIVSFEESPAELMLNLGDLGGELSALADDDKLTVFAARPTQYGLERHLVSIYREFDRFEPDLVIIDPITSLQAAGDLHHVHRMLVRLLDNAKRRNITGIYTMQMSELDRRNPDVPLSSIIDHWMHIVRRKSGRKPPFRLTVIKARGLDHWHDPVGLSLSNHGPAFTRLEHRDDD